jgi:UDP-N-acetylmuramoyl-tripeptide--D-alanyl-D-alanine ligase
MQLTLAEIAELLQTAPPPARQLLATGYSIDSRTIRPRELFFAVQGQRLDGHDFVRAALDAGAVGAVVANHRCSQFPAEVETKLLGVPDPLGALQALAAAVRKRWGGPVVAVTGSTGKTTTKQMIASLLGTKHKVLENPGNLNNQFGLPLSLLCLEPEHQIGVFELGMSAAGEIRLLTQLAQPEVGVVTNVSGVHLEFFPDVDAIARAKRELIETMGPEAWAVLNADDSRVNAFGRGRSSRCVYFGMDCPAHVRAEQVEPDGQGGTWFRLGPEKLREVPLGGAWRQHAVSEERAGNLSPQRFHLPLLGRHNVLNVLAALAVCHLFGIAAPELVAAVAKLQPAAMRGELLRLASGAWVINDCYNSNPEALEAMLQAASALPARRHLAVLGSMKELGPQSAALHVQCGRRVAELRFDGLVTVGEEARPFAEGARVAGMPETALVHCASAKEAGDYLRTRLCEGDVVLLKASRAVHLEGVWSALGPANSVLPEANTPGQAAKIATEG